jgi:hypothetical protein
VTAAVKPRPLGAYSKQRAALAALAIPVVARLGMRPAASMVARATWGADHDVNPHRDYSRRGVRCG